MPRTSEPWLQALASAPPIEPHGDDLLAGTVLAERFVIGRRLGRGGMGVVYLAHDRRLDRKIALKLHQRIHGERGAMRLEDEARALAGLSHPNVVAIYDVVRDSSRLLIAMEYVEAGDARAWVDTQEPSLNSVLRLYRGAAAGLQAAHELGIVHADFKPDNVLLGRDEAAVLIDFGLGGTAVATPQSPGVAASSASRPIVGTRAYMAPESREGIVGPAVDQFALCVSIAEAVFGRRPQAGTSAAEISGWTPRLHASASECRRLAAVLEVGLRADPAKRHPSVEEVAGRLAEVPRKRGRKGVWIAAALVVGVGAAALGLGGQPAPTCGEDDPDLREHYATSTRPELRLAYERHPAGSLLWPPVDARLEDYIDRLNGALERSCDAEADTVPPLRACLQDRRRRVDALSQVLAAGGPKLLLRGLSLVDALPSIETCETQDSSDIAPLPDDPATAREVAAIRAGLIEVETLRGAKKYAESLALAAALRDRWRAIAFPPLGPRLLFELGKSELAADEIDAGIEHLDAAYFTARAQRRDRLALSAALEIVDGSAAQPQLRARWIAHAESLATEADRPRIAYARALLDVANNDYDAAVQGLAQVQAAQTRPRLKVAILGLLAQTLCRIDRAPEALVRIEDALPIARRHFGEQSLEVARLLDFRGMAHVATSELEAALVDQTQARDMTAAVVGADSDQTLGMEDSLGQVLSALGRNEEAEAILQRVLDGRRAVFGDEHRMVAFAYLNLGINQIKLGRLEVAEANLREALALFDGPWGGPIDVAFTLQGLGTSVVGRDPSLAADYLRRAVETLEGALGDTHLDTVGARLALAEALVAAEDYKAATVLLEPQLAALRSRNGGRSVLVVDALTLLCHAELELDLGKQAMHTCEEALTTVQATPPRAAFHPGIAFLAAQAADAVKDRERADALVRVVVEMCSGDEPCQVDMDSFEAWQAQR